MSFALEPILVAMLAAAIYAVSGYFRQVFKSENGEPFDPIKFSSTLVVGALVGFTAQIMGIPVYPEYIEAQLIVYAGVIVLVENAVVGVIRLFAPNRVVLEQTGPPQ